MANQYTEQLFKEILREVSAKDLENLLPFLKVIQVTKKTYLIQPGKISQTMNFIAKGCLRSFYADEEGNEHILQFAIENWWINDLYSYLSQTPSRMFIEAIEDSYVVQIRKDDLEKLFEESLALSNFFRIKLQKAYVTLQERMLSKMSLTAYERYLSFIQQYRSIEQRIPQYMVASYLGITPEFLSHLRKKYSHAIS